MPLKVYYLDDEPDFCDIFTDFFASKEVVVTTFIEAADLLKASITDPPDVFFTDFRLPGTTGLDVARSMAERIPKYLITGDLSIENSEAFKKIFHKPYDPNDIQLILEEYLKPRPSFAI